MSFRPDNLLLAIDGGGSHCRALLGTANGEILAKYTGKSANIWTNPDSSRKEVLDVCKTIVTNAGYLPNQIFPYMVVCAGLAGGERESARASFLKQDWPFKSLVLLHDSTIALEGAFDGDGGGLVILGTGISACFKHGNSYTHLNGWGFPFDDRGSGAWLGQRALQITLRAETGLIAMNPLAKLILEHFDNNPDSIIDFTRFASARDFAKFAPRVWDLAEAGVDDAKHLVKQAATEVESLFDLMHRRGARRFTIVGGMSRRILPWLSEYWQKNHEHPRQEPLMGAFTLAKKNL